MNQPTEQVPTAWPQLSDFIVRLRQLRNELGRVKPGTETLSNASAEIWGAAIPVSGESALSRWSAIGLGPLHSPVEAATSWVAKISPAGKADQTQWLSAIYPGRPSVLEATQHFMDQRTPLLLGELGQWRLLKANAGFKFGVSVPDGELSWFGTDFAVLNSERMEWCLEFLDYLYLPEVSLELFATAATLPVSKVQSESPAWKKELAQWPALKVALTRKLRPLEMSKIAPQLREEWINLTWKAVEQSRSTELGPILQKLLSTNSR